MGCSTGGACPEADAQRRMTIRLPLPQQLARRTPQRLRNNEPKSQNMRKYSTCLLAPSIHQEARNRDLVRSVAFATFSSSYRQNQQMTLKPVPTSGRFKVNFVCRHHNEPRVQLFVPNEETFPIPLKYIDVTRTTLTSLDVLQEKRINDYWNVDMDRTLSGSWTGFTKFTFMNEKPPPRYMWSGQRFTKNQATTRPDLLPEIWVGMSRRNQSSTTLEN